MSSVVLTWTGTLNKLKEGTVQQHRSVAEQFPKQYNSCVMISHKRSATFQDGEVRVA